jgi:NAD(P)-dependent dehydrogenase (short-subunit alcohol dehydrogenase family)
VASLDGKVFVVTGGASGIGAATVRRLAADGAAVAVGDIDGDGAARIAGEVTESGGRALGCRCDMAEESDVAALVDAAVGEFGGLDGADHNAGWTNYAKDRDALEVDLDVWDRVLRVNTRGALVLARHAIPHLRARGGGSLVHISSGAGTIGEATRVAYGTSKAAIDQLTRHLAARYGREGIRANSVAPGLVLTDSARRGLSDDQVAHLAAANPSGRLGTPEDIAAVVAFLLSDDAGYINGQTIHVDGGLQVVGRLAAGAADAAPVAQPPSAPAAS